MKDFFDEDFPLSKKQEEELNKRAQTPKTLEEPIVEEAKNPNIPAYDPENDNFSYIPVDEDEPIDEAFSYTPPEEDDEEAFEEDLEETNDEIVEEAAEEACEDMAYEPVNEPVFEEDPPEVLAFDFFDEPLEEEKDEEPAAEEEKAPAVSHDEYLAKLRQMNEIEQQLQREIKSLGEQLDSVEMKVDSLPDESTQPEADEDEQAEFSYEYDERYFAEEETPAYKHPELYKKPAKTVKKTAKRKPAKKGEVTLNVKTLLGVGAAVAAAVAAAKLLSGDDKK